MVCYEHSSRSDLKIIIFHVRNLYKLSFLTFSYDFTIWLVLDFFLARTLDWSLAETGVLDFKFKFVPVAACGTRIDSDLHAFRAVLGRWTVANSAFCYRPAAQNFNVGINTCCCCRVKIQSFSHVTSHLSLNHIRRSHNPPSSALLPCLSYYGSYWKIIGRAPCCAGGKKGGMCCRCRGW